MDELVPEQKEMIKNFAGHLCVRIVDGKMELTEAWKFTCAELTVFITGVVNAERKQLPATHHRN